jgi:hypothetical protein
LATTNEISITLPSAVIASPSVSATTTKILALIEDEEGKYQTSLNDTYLEMGEKTFKGLRRALPMTRQKIDWDKVWAPFNHHLANYTPLGILGTWIQAWSGAVSEQGCFW